MRRAHPSANPFSAKKEIRRGKSQKKAKGAAGGARAGLPALGAAYLLAAALEFGSRKSVKLHHFGKRTEIAALWGGFFSGGAQRQPAVFLGGG